LLIDDFQLKTAQHDFAEPFEKGILEWFCSGFLYSWIPAYAGMTGLGAYRHSRPVSSTGQAPAGIQGPFVPENQFCKRALKGSYRSHNLGK